MADDVLQRLPDADCHLRYRWKRTGAWLVLGFALIFGWVIVSAVLDGVRRHAMGPGALGVVPLGFAALLMAYYAIAGIVNSSDIVLRDGQLTVRHGPLPWFGNRSIAARDIRTVVAHAIGPVGRRSFAVIATLHSGRNVNISSSFVGPSMIYEIERVLREALRLPPG